MILEFLNNFGDVFELSNDFPNGFSLGLKLKHQLVSLIKQFIYFILFKKNY
jgi:hypothetical protein